MLAPRIFVWAIGPGSNISKKTVRMIFPPTPGQQSMSLGVPQNGWFIMENHPPSNYPGGVGATHFVRGPTPPSYKMGFPSLQNGNAAQTPYKMAVPSPPLA